MNPPGRAARLLYQETIQMQQGPCGRGGLLGLHSGAEEQGKIEEIPANHQNVLKK